MITQHPIDNLSLMRAIELLEHYRFLMNTTLPQVSKHEDDYITVTIKNLRNALKCEVRTQ